MKTISEIRRLFIDYHQNPVNYVDHSRGTVTHRGQYAAPIKSLDKILGLELLGLGARAHVYALSPTRVLKVCSRLDQGYDPFIRAAREANNPHLPKVYYIGNWADHPVYVLERLEFGNESEKNFLRDEMYRRYNRLDDPSPEEPSSIRWYQATNDPFGPELSDALRVVKNVTLNPPPGTYLSVDLHGGNIMLRGDIPVITDPLID